MLRGFFRESPHGVGGAKIQLDILVLKSLLFILSNEIQLTSVIVVLKISIFCILIWNGPYIYKKR